MSLICATARRASSCRTTKPHAIIHAAAQPSHDLAATRPFIVMPIEAIQQRVTGSGEPEGIRGVLRRACPTLCKLASACSKEQKLNEVRLLWAREAQGILSALNEDDRKR